MSHADTSVFNKKKEKQKSKGCCNTFFSSILYSECQRGVSLTLLSLRRGAQAG